MVIFFLFFFVVLKKPFTIPSHPFHCKDKNQIQRKKKKNVQDHVYV